MKRETLLSAMLILGGLLVLSHATPAQRKIITLNDYMEGTRVKWFERSRHVETLAETIANGVTTRSETIISDVLLPGRRFRDYRKITEGGNVTESEQITIDSMRYTRKDGGAWTKIDMTGTGSGNSPVSHAPRYPLDQYSVEATNLNGSPMQLFDLFSTCLLDNELTFLELQVWIGDDGLVYRSEETRGKLSPRIESSRNVATWDYDPNNIKIEAPIK